VRETEGKSVIKTRVIATLAVLGFAFLMPATSAHAGTPPHIDSISPTQANPPGNVTINGTNLYPFSTVKFGSTSTSYSGTATQLVAAIPAGSGTVAVTVTTPDGTSNAINFTYGQPLPPPGTKVTVGPGTSIETQNGPLDGGGSWCTVAAVGNDAAGNMVAITAGHCYAPQSIAHLPVRLSDTVNGTGQQIGTYETLTSYPQGQTTLPVDSRLDYSIIKLDPNVVQLTNVAPNGTKFDHLNLNVPQVGQQMCKYGQVSGYTCASIASFSNNTIHSGATIIPGDSGGGVIIDGGFAGINSAINPFINPTSQFTSMIGVMDDLTARGPSTVGYGFTPLP
jgi:hypothetical protein